jgi:zinc/manganese transport system substrate-binding protein
MRFNVLVLVLGLVLGALTPVPASAAVKVVTTTEGLAAVVREVGGDRVKVESLSRGVQDPHFVDPNPMLAVKLRGADLLVDVGLDLEIGWLPPLVTQSRNGDIQPGGKRRLTAASFVSVLELPTGPVDRSLGDIHPGGNPHFFTDPRRVVEVASAIADKLSELDPGGRDAYAKGLAGFKAKLDAANARWQAQLAPVKGRPVMTRHRTLPYFFAWSGLVSAGELEPKPGIPPPPAHLAEMVEIAKQRGVKALVVENYYDTKSAAVVAEHSGAKVVQIPGDVGGEPAAKDYVSYMDTVVSRIVGAVK